METNDKKRIISLADTTLLITKAGGRCSYNHKHEYCNKILSDGRVNLGERAHIVGVSGPRANVPFNGNKNGYDNLIWLCRDHHKIIDHPTNLEKYTVKTLQVMKSRHENKIITGRYPYYGTPQSLHDFSVLSCLFEFINIHTLYSCAASYPVIHLDFFDVSDMCYHFRHDNPGDLPLRDPILKRAFLNFERTHERLSIHLNPNRTVKEDKINFWYEWTYSRIGENLVFNYLASVERLISLIEQRFPQILHQEVYEPFPDIGI